MTAREIDLAIADAERVITFVGSTMTLAHTPLEALAQVLAAAKAMRERLEDNDLHG